MEWKEDIKLERESTGGTKKSFIFSALLRYDWEIEIVYIWVVQCDQKFFSTIVDLQYYISFRRTT